MIAPLTPQRHIGLGDDPFAEIQLAEVHENFFDDGLVHELDMFAGRFLERRKAREEPREGS